MRMGNISPGVSTCRTARAYVRLVASLCIGGRYLQFPSISDKGGMDAQTSSSVLAHLHRVHIKALTKSTRAGRHVNEESL